MHVCSSAFCQGALPICQAGVLHCQELRNATSCAYFPSPWGCPGECNEGLRVERVPLLSTCKGVTCR